MFECQMCQFLVRFGQRFANPCKIDGQTKFTHTPYQQPRRGVGEGQLSVLHCTEEATQISSHVSLRNKTDAYTNSF